MSIPYVIMGRMQYTTAEVVDRAETKQEAEYLLNEYRIAFGPQWELWIEEETGE